MIAASVLLAEHGGAIEADLQQFYGTHIGDFPHPLTYRRLCVLLEGLPPQATFWTSIRAETRPTPANPTVTYQVLERHGITIPDELKRR